MLLSVVIPVHNEEQNISPTVEDLVQHLDDASIPFELVLVDDCSKDDSWLKICELTERDKRIRGVQRTVPPGFGRAIRTGIESSRGDVLTMVMADSSDRPMDVVLSYQKISEGYDCVFGSRFVVGSTVEGYPPVKLFVNRLVNRALQLLFLTPHNDLTNAVKMYRREVIEACGPYQSCHFNITLELSLSALIRRYSIGIIPIHWYGRKWGVSKLSLWKMGRKYLSVIVKAFCEKLLIADDLLAEKVKGSQEKRLIVQDLLDRVEELEKQVEVLKTKSV
jgi:dolichol-phosphate mannosyltransferase